MKKIKLQHRPEGYLFPLNDQGVIDVEGELTLIVYESCEFKKLAPITNWYPNDRIEKELQEGIHISEFNNRGFDKPQLSIVNCNINDINIAEFEIIYEKYHIVFDDDDKFEDQDGDQLKQVRFDNLRTFERSTFRKIYK